jgi:ribonuclease I
MRRNLLLLLTLTCLINLYKGFFTNSEKIDEEIDPGNLNFLATPIHRSNSFPQDYDMYVFSVQWGATLCHSNSHNCADRLQSIPKNIFTLHGLWPNLSNGHKMDKCNPGGEVKIKKGASQIFDEMEKFWISFTHDDNSFWSHEYNTHGFCYTQKYNIDDPLHYFEYALNLYKKHDLGRIFLRAFGNVTGSHSFDLHDLDNHIDRATGDLKYELVCRHYEHKQYLQEIRFFFDLNLNAMDIGRKGDCNQNSPIIVDFQ